MGQSWYSLATLQTLISCLLSVLSSIHTPLLGMNRTSRLDLTDDGHSTSGHYKPGICEVLSQKPKRDIFSPAVPASKCCKLCQHRPSLLPCSRVCSLLPLPQVLGLQMCHTTHGTLSVVDYVLYIYTSSSSLFLSCLPASVLVSKLCTESLTKEKLQRLRF